MSVETIQNTRQNLIRIADHLLLARPDIIKTWEEKAKADPQLASLAGLNRKEFLDHVPQILDILDAQIRLHAADSENDRDRQAAEKLQLHGLSRWQQGFSIKEVVRDWNHLRQSIVHSITDGLAQNPDWLERSFPDAARIISDLVAEGINHSVAKFEEIRQSEAKSQTLELQKMVETLTNESDRQRRNYDTLRHDLRGHLGIMHSLMSVFNSSSRDKVTSNLDNLYKAMEEGLEKSLGILSDISLHASLEAGENPPELSHFNISKLVRSCTKAYAEICDENGIKLKLEGPQSLEIENDLNKIGRILQDILHNAVKFTASGTVTVQWGIADDDRFCTVHVSSTGTLTPNETALPFGANLVSAAASSPLPASCKEVDESRKMKKETVERSDAGRESIENFDNDREGISLSIAKRLCEVTECRLSVEPDEKTYGITARIVVPIKFPRSES